ncbi:MULTISPECIES: bifunctional acetaldehyde-CoA/alcohol dehydrogenase [Clostridium]|uniref:bifunctional acetaldehyde-CoA/alcohol dehydrogenase n=1 Tax=Clostridium TaxID=1485 RepID=UPI00082540E4|nr:MULTISPECIES: bifunctional acetaldehyde-CoA/alcohol dehydrogenase [Clostridium]PJI10094.1 bifunctional acetaldehyde-CoA/alcohol dehydrogenase [Clostridium sp. CT7]
MKVSTTKELDETFELVQKAQKEFSYYSQEKVDEIFRNAAMAAIDARIELAKAAVKETGMGLVEDKVIKNHFAGEYIYNRYKDEKTCGVIEKNEPYGITKIAEPIGVVAAIIPVTNPTSTAIFKSLISLKTRNGILFSPHPRAKKSTILAAKIILDAAVKSGAPENIIGWIDNPTIELTQYLMQKADITLATGGPSLVKSAYSSGKPAIGVGPGNTPVIIDDSANIKMAVSSIILSKTYDNGVICASEQSVIVLKSIYNSVRAEFEKRGAYIIKKDEMDNMRQLIFKDGRINPKIVGQSAYTIASMAGIIVPKTTRILVGEVTSLSEEEPFAHEKLSPILAMYKAEDFDDALNKAVTLVNLGGLGHTSGIYADVIKSQDKIDKFSNAMKTVRTFVNIPTAQGASGDLYNFKIPPSFTLGCGFWGGNSISENVGPKHLLNIKTVAERRENMLWFRVPEKIYFKFGCLQFALRDLKELNKKRAYIVTNKDLYNQNYVEPIIKILESIGIEFKVFSQLEKEADLKTISKGASEMLSFMPDTIIALGGTSAMSAAKLMWVMYEHPEVKFEDLAIKFMDIRKRIYTFPKLGEKAMLVAVTTSAGSGSEVTPFAVVTDDKTGNKYTLADYEMTPNMAIIDAELMMNMSQKLTAYSGMDALVNAIEAYTSVYASEYTNGLALEAIRLILKYLPEAYHNGKSNEKAREKMAHASTMAGMASANAFLGLCHSMAIKLSSEHNIARGVANALLIEEVIKFNAVNNPVKQAPCPQYKYPNTIFRYARIADYINLGGSTDDEKVTLLIKKIHELKEELNIPKSISDAGVSQKSFYDSLDKISERALDDQCTGTNPRFPLTSEIKDMYVNCFKG